MPEVTSITVTENTLYNLTITEESGTTLALSIPNTETIINTSLNEIDAVMQNNGSGKGVYKTKDSATFVMRSINDDGKTTDVNFANSDNEVQIKLPDAGISTPDNFQINADSDSSAKIELPGATVDLSKAKLLTDLDVNSQDLTNVDNITAASAVITTADINAGTIDSTVIGAATPLAGTFTTATATDLVVSGTAMVTGDYQVGSTMSVYGNATFNSNINQTSGNSATFPVLNTTTASITTANISTVDINAGSIDNTTVGASSSSTGRFSTLESAQVDINGGAIDGVIIGANAPGTIVTTNLTATTADINGGNIDGTIIGATQQRALHTSDLTADTADINAGTIDGTVVGATTPAAVSTTNLIATTVDINAGHIDNTRIGKDQPVLGTFSTVEATTGDITTVNATTINTADLNVSDDLVVTDDALISGDFTVTGNTILTGNLTINGTSTTVNTETVTIEDNNIVLNSNHTGTPTANGGITVERGTSDDAIFQWNETTDAYDFLTGTDFADIKSKKGLFTDYVSIGAGVTLDPNNKVVDLAVNDGMTIGGDLLVSGTSNFAILGFVNTVQIDCNDKATGDGHGLLIYDSTLLDSWATTSNNLDDVLHAGGTAPKQSGSAACPIVYITNESIEIHKNTTETGDPGETHAHIEAGQAEFQIGDSSWDGKTTITGSRIQTTNGEVLTQNLEVSVLDKEQLGTHISLKTDLLPEGANQKNIGSASLPFLNVQAENIRADQGYLAQIRGTYAGASPEAYSNTSTANLLPITNSTGTNGYSLGQSTSGSGSLYYKGVMTRTLETDVLKATAYSTTSPHNAQSGNPITLKSHIIPDGNKTLDLGSSTKAFRSVYVGDGSLYIDGHKVLGSDASGQIDITTDTDQNLNINAGGSGSSGTITMSSAGNTTQINDTTVNLGPALNGATINARGALNVNGNADFNGTVEIDTFTIGASAGKIESTGNAEIKAASGYIWGFAPNTFVGLGNSGAHINATANGDALLQGYGAGYGGTGKLNITAGDVVADSFTGNLAGNLTADATTEKLTTKKIISNASALTIPGVTQFGGFNLLTGGTGIGSTTTPATGYPFVGVQQSASGQDQPQAAYFINNMNYDISGGLSGAGVMVSFAAQDESGKLLDIASNLTKLRLPQVSGSAGSSTVTSWDGEYTLSVTGNAGSGASNVTTNVLTTNTLMTEVSQELRVVDKPGNSGSTALSGIYLTYDGAQTGNPSGLLQLRDNDADTNTESMKLEEARITFGTVTKQFKASSDPSGENGDTYYNTSTNKFKGYANGAWVDLH